MAAKSLKGKEKRNCSAAYCSFLSYDLLTPRKQTRANLKQQPPQLFVLIGSSISRSAWLFFSTPVDVRVADTARRDRFKRSWLAVARNPKSRSRACLAPHLPLSRGSANGAQPATMMKGSTAVFPDTIGFRFFLCVLSRFLSTAAFFPFLFLHIAMRVPAVCGFRFRWACHFTKMNFFIARPMKAVRAR